MWSYLVGLGILALIIVTPSASMFRSSFVDVSDPLEDRGRLNLL